LKRAATATHEKPSVVKGRNLSQANHQSQIEQAKRGFLSSRRTPHAARFALSVHDSPFTIRGF
jgi:hypothetical protein